MVYKNTFLSSELVDTFEDVLKTDEMESIIYCSLRDGIFCNNEEFLEHNSKFTKTKIDEAREAILSIHKLTVESLQSTEGVEIPVTAYIGLVMFSISQSYDHTTAMCLENNNLNAIANAFLYRIYYYAISMWLQTVFYSEALEVVTVIYDKYKD